MLSVRFLSGSCVKRSMEEEETEKNIPKGDTPDWRWRSMWTSFNHHYPHLSLNREGRWGITYDFKTSFLHFPLFSAALWDLANSRPVDSPMLSSHLFFCLSCLLPPFTVPCKTVLARPDERETWPYHCSLRLFTMFRRSSCGPTADVCTGTYSVKGREEESERDHTNKVWNNKNDENFKKSNALNLSIVWKIRGSKWRTCS